MMLSLAVLFSVLSPAFSFLFFFFCDGGISPRSITGFQQHDTPVLMSDGDRAEIADESCTFPEYSSFCLSLFLPYKSNRESFVHPLFLDAKYLLSDFAHSFFR